MLGEEVVDNSTWIVKTHYPQLLFPLKFTADKIICVTRHPVDVIPSFAHLIWSQSHSVEPKKPLNEYKIWPGFVKEQIRVFGEYHKLVIEQAKTTPTFFLTYEQMIVEPEKVMTELFCFLLGVKSLEGTLTEAQIKKMVSKGHKDPIL
jgi:hypothetical protein